MPSNSRSRISSAVTHFANNVHADVVNAVELRIFLGSAVHPLRGYLHDFGIADVGIRGCYCLSHLIEDLGSDSSRHFTCHWGLLSSRSTTGIRIVSWSSSKEKGIQ